MDGVAACVAVAPVNLWQCSVASLLSQVRRSTVKTKLSESSSGSLSANPLISLPQRRCALSVRSAAFRVAGHESKIGNCARKQGLIDHCINPLDMAMSAVDRILEEAHQARH